MWMVPLQPSFYDLSWLVLSPLLSGYCMDETPSSS